MTALRTVDGRTLAIGRELASGGEGRVHEICGSGGEVAKIYHSAPSPALAAKLAAIVRMRTHELESVAAWPNGILLSPTGAVTGFLMPRVDARGVIDRLSHPCERRQHFAEADYLFICTVAANLMSAASVLHSRGVVIGDVNESNVMVRPNGTVSFIDVDSFQVCANGTVHRCGVAKDLFIPPELVGRNLSNIDRTPMQDCFGLAVLVFQLLMNGRHPFHGCVLDGVDRTTQELVAAGAYAYSPSSRLPVRPPPGAIAPSTLGALAPLFERAFLSSTRPSALEWAEALSRFKQGLRPCKSNRRHAVFPGQSACVLCTLPRDPLPPPLGTAPGAAPDVGSIRQLLAEIARIAPPAHAAMQPAEPPIADGDRECPTQQGEPSPADVRRAEHAGFPFGTLIATLIAAAIVVALAMSGRTSGGVCVFGFGLAALVLMLAGQIARWSERSRARRYVASYAARRTAVATELMALESAERSAREFLTRVESLAPRVERLRTAAAAIEDADRRATNDLTTNAVRRFKDYWQEEQLDAFRIGTATIPGIGLERKRVLASHGIETAADVNARDIRGVPGFGPKLTEAILDWRASCVRVVARRTIPPIPSSFIDSMRQEHAIGLAKSVQGMREEFLALRDVLGNMESAGRHHAEDVSKARAAFRQARVRALDLKPR